jgi:hypothetical protein
VKPAVQFGINDKYSPSIENGKDDVFNSNRFTSSICFDATLESDKSFLFTKTE